MAIAREFIIPGNQKASDYCPAVPRTVKVYARNRVEAFKKLSEALKKDPQLKEVHPELTGLSEDYKERKAEESKPKPAKKTP